MTKLNRSATHEKGNSGVDSELGLARNHQVIHSFSPMESPGLKPPRNENGRPSRLSVGNIPDSVQRGNQFLKLASPHNKSEICSINNMNSESQNMSQGESNWVERENKMKRDQVDISPKDREIERKIQSPLNSGKKRDHMFSPKKEDGSKFDSKWFKVDDDFDDMTEESVFKKMKKLNQRQTPKANFVKANKSKPQKEGKFLGFLRSCNIIS